MALLELKNVHLEFAIFGHRSIRKHLFSRYTGGSITVEEDNVRTGHHIIRALDDVSLTLKSGDRLGIVGHNGAGKTTILKVMAGVYPPTSGTVRIEGRVSPMFNTSLGMDPEDTGYENICTMGLHLGMSPADIREKTPQIAEFCELGEFLELPVRVYSAGMVTRLAFAIATSIQPEILILDEGIGAGDARFAEKVTRRTNELIESSTILILATHSLDMIRSMCNKAMLLERGKLLAFGDVAPVLATYDQMVRDSLLTV